MPYHSQQSCNYSTNLNRIINVSQQDLHQNNPNYEIAPQCRSFIGYSLACVNQRENTPHAELQNTYFVSNVTPQPISIRGEMSHNTQRTRRIFPPPPPTALSSTNSYGWLKVTYSPTQCDHLPENFLAQLYSIYQCTNIAAAVIIVIVIDNQRSEPETGTYSDL